MFQKETPRFDGIPVFATNGEGSSQQAMRKVRIHSSGATGEHPHDPPRGFIREYHVPRNNTEGVVSQEIVMKEGKINKLVGNVRAAVSRIVPGR
jgi:hypothetical protein